MKKHWNIYGKKEGRICHFDWCLYIKNYNLLSKSIDNRTKAIQHWLTNGKPEINNKNELDYEYELFNWHFYINKYEDLKHINSREMAWDHWINFGRKENRVSHNFKWSNYLLLNNDLIQAGIITESQALYHYIKHGINENRKIN